MEPDGTTVVTIYGQQYTVRGGPDAEHVHQIAAFVDSKMREAARGSSQVSSLRVAVLAAMNIAEELHQERAREQSDQDALLQRAERLARTLERHCEA
jgi:cell division protein ZapA